MRNFVDNETTAMQQQEFLDFVRRLSIFRIVFLPEEILYDMCFNLDFEYLHTVVAQSEKQRIREETKEEIF